MRKNTIKKKDITKLYWDDPEEFADIFNAVYFHGEEVLRADELAEQDSNLPLLEMKEADYGTTEQSRDLLKLANHVWSRGACLLLVGFENQTEIHYAMPLRIMGYEYRNYRRQYENQARRYKENGYTDMTGAEMLSGIRKTDRLLPVVTVVLYYGIKPWDGAKSLHEMLEIPEEMRAHVADYPMHLIEVRSADLPVHTKRNKDFFNLTKILLEEGKTVEERMERTVKYEETGQVDALVMMTVNAMFAGGRIPIKQRQEGTAMLDIFEEAMNRGKREGEKEGIRQGKADAIMELLSCKGNISDELCKIIREQKNEETLNRWLLLAAHSESIEAFRATI